jgi:hypothetical protein
MGRADPVDGDEERGGQPPIPELRQRNLDVRGVAVVEGQLDMGSGRDRIERGAKHAFA